MSQAKSKTSELAEKNAYQIIDEEDLSDQEERPQLEDSDSDEEVAITRQHFGSLQRNFIPDYDSDIELPDPTDSHDSYSDLPNRVLEVDIDSDGEVNFDVAKALKKKADDKKKALLKKAGKKSK